jgi:ribosomal protein L22
MAEPKKDTEKKEPAKKPATKAKPAAKKAAGKTSSSKAKPAATKAKSETAAEATSKTADKQAAESATSSSKAKPAAQTSSSKVKPKTKRAKAAAKPASKSKAKEPEDRPVVRARASYVRIAPRKVRLIADQVRGMPLDEALTTLRFSPRGAAQDIAKLINSAAANAENNHDLVADDLLISDITVDEGPTLRRYRPRAMGRATRINKRTSHIQVALTPEN